MRNAFVAEWLVSRWTDKRRAASMVGDLVELESQKGPLWFWLSIARIVVSLAWRPVLGWLAAFYVGGWSSFAFMMATHGIHAQHRPPEYPWMPIFDALAHAGALLWVMVVYTAVRYGPRDRATQLSLALACSTAGVIYLWWQPLALAVCLAVAAAALLVSLLRRGYRSAGVVVAVAVTCGFTGGSLWELAEAMFLRVLFPPHVNLQDPRRLFITSFGTLALMAMLAWFITAACSRMHRWLMPSEQTDLALD